MSSKWAFIALVIIHSFALCQSNNLHAQQVPAGPSMLGSVFPGMQNSGVVQAGFHGHAAGSCMSCDNGGYEGYSTGVCPSCGQTGCDGNCGGYCGDDGCDLPCKKYLFSTEAMYLKLSGPSHRDLVINQDTDVTAIATDDVLFDSQVGIRSTFGMMYSKCDMLEFSYFGLQKWNNTFAERAGDNNLALPGDVGLASDDFFGADAMTVSYSAEIHNAEFNVVHRFCDYKFSFLTGFRYFNLVEKLNIHSVDSDADESDYNVGARNNLYGGQIGGLYDLKVGNVTFQFVSKAGVYGNSARETNVLFDNNNSFEFRNVTTEGSHVAFIGEAGVNAKVQLTSWLWARGGYTFLWLDKVARGAEQVDFTNDTDSGTRLDLNGQAFLQGATIGLEANW